MVGQVPKALHLLTRGVLVETQIAGLPELAPNRQKNEGILGILSSSTSISWDNAMGARIQTELNAPPSVEEVWQQLQ